MERTRLQVSEQNDWRYGNYRNCVWNNQDNDEALTLPTNRNEMRINVSKRVMSREMYHCQGLVVVLIIPNAIAIIMLKKHLVPPIRINNKFSNSKQEEEDRWSLLNGITFISSRDSSTNQQKHVRYWDRNGKTRLNKVYVIAVEQSYWSRTRMAWQWPLFEHIFLVII